MLILEETMYEDIIFITNELFDKHEYEFEITLPKWIQENKSWDNDIWYIGLKSIQIFVPKKNRKDNYFKVICDQIDPEWSLDNKCIKKIPKMMNDNFILFLEPQNIQFYPVNNNLFLQGRKLTIKILNQKNIMLNSIKAKEKKVTSIIIRIAKKIQQMDSDSFFCTFSNKNEFFPNNKIGSFQCVLPETDNLSKNDYEMCVTDVFIPGLKYTFNFYLQITIEQISNEDPIWYKLIFDLQDLENIGKFVKVLKQKLKETVINKYINVIIKKGKITFELTDEFPEILIFELDFSNDLAKVVGNSGDHFQNPHIGLSNLLEPKRELNSKYNLNRILPFLIVISTNLISSKELNEYQPKGFLTCFHVNTSKKEELNENLKYIEIKNPLYKYIDPGMKTNIKFDVKFIGCDECIYNNENAEILINVHFRKLK